MMVVNGRAGASDQVQYGVLIDTNGNQNPEYQFGFWNEGAWIWNLSGSGYADWNNLSFLEAHEYQAVIGEVVEFEVPLGRIDNVSIPSISASTVIYISEEESPLANPPTAIVPVPSKVEQLAQPKPNETLEPSPTMTSTSTPLPPTPSSTPTEPPPTATLLPTSTSSHRPAQRKPHRMPPLASAVGLFCRCWWG
jgi:hypothetical protein